MTYDAHGFPHAEPEDLDALQGADGRFLLANGEDPSGGGDDGGGGGEAPEGFPDWEMAPVAPPGLDDYMPTFLGWLWWICMPIGIVAIVAAGVMMALGRFGGRGAVAADGLRQFVWACVGIAVITLSIPVVTGLFSI